MGGQGRMTGWQVAQHGGQGAAVVQHGRGASQPLQLSADEGQGCGQPLSGAPQAWPQLFGQQAGWQDELQFVGAELYGPEE
jgi:hypothetical protein